MSHFDVSTRDLAGVGNEREAPEEADLSQSRDEQQQPLLPQDQAERYRSEWQRIQAGFVDEPRRSVEEADRLVADLMQRLAAVFSDEREQLEKQWDSGDDVSTEDLRVALTRYRSFFDRLLSA
ncbi:MAG: hypothetical protein ACJ74N_14820 [Gaiellaceae bacterium]